MPSSTFERVPGEVLHEIAVFVGGLTFLGPPSDVRSMILLSKQVSDKVNWDHVHAAIFRQKFDESAPVRRLGKLCKVDSTLAAELAKRFEALKRLKNDAYLDFDAETLRLDLWTAYLMFLESEEKNAKQLVEYARVDTFASNYISPRVPLHIGADDNHGSIVDSENNALALSLYWFTDYHRVKRETSKGRRTTHRSLLKLVASLMTPSTTFPLTTFRIPSSNHQMPSTLQSTDSSLGWPPGPVCTVPDYFGFKLTVTRPLLSSPLYLSTAVRTEAIDANDLRSIESALVDWDNERTGTNAGAKSYDADWARLRPHCKPQSQPATTHTVFKPGTLHGKWAGRRFHSYYIDDSLLRTSVPMQLHIREHHQVCQDDVLAYDDNDLFNAWLPRNTTMKEIRSDLLVYNPNTQQSSKYHTYDPFTAADDDVDEDETPHKHQGLYGASVHDILITAETNETFEQTEGQCWWEGRVRDFDGLVMMVRRTGKEYQRCIFYGEVHGARTIIGRWQNTTSPSGEAGSSGVWCMTKEDDIPTIEI